MRIALIDAHKPPRKGAVYPYPLLKLGAWRRSLGDECRLFTNRVPSSGFDEAWVTTLFTYELPRALHLARAARTMGMTVRVGGIAASLKPDFFEREGMEVHSGLVPEAEGRAPDFSLLQELPDYAVTFTSRGCVRRCQFCMVTRLEPHFKVETGWSRDIHQKARRILFYDNNWLAKTPADLESDVEEIIRLRKEGNVRTVDFNQGLDCRLLTARKADIISRIHHNPLRFSWDGRQEDGHIERAIRLMGERGSRDVRVYVLYNYLDTPREIYRRLHTLQELTASGVARVASFPMRYQPILDLDPHREHTGPGWTPRERRAFMAILSTHAGEGIISPFGGRGISSQQEFELYYGRDEDEFVRLLNYPRIRELAHSRRAVLRQSRARLHAAEQQEHESLARRLEIAPARSDT
jgi:hypothetical protein